MKEKLANTQKSDDMTTKQPVPAEPVQNAPEVAATFINPEPWHRPVKLDRLLNELVHIIRKYVILKEHEYIAVALWILHTHSFDAWTISPILCCTSPEMRCGKSTALGLIQACVPKPLMASSVTAAAVYRAINEYQVSLLIDEADALARSNETLRGVLNSGHNRNGAQVVRSGENGSVITYSTWAPKVIGIIGLPWKTLIDRSIMIQFQRRLPTEHVDPLPGTIMDDMLKFRRKATRWGVDNVDALRSAIPSIPAGLHDRAIDNWRPLLAIAELAGPKWSKKALDAAILCSNGVVEDESIRVELLRDLKQVFHKDDIIKLTSGFIVNALNGMEDRPWPTFNRGGDLTKANLAHMLKSFRVYPQNIRINDLVVKGYLRTDLEEPFARYASCKEDSGIRDQAEEIIPVVKSKEQQMNDSEIEAKIKDGVEYLRKKDPGMAGLIDKYGPCEIFKEKHSPFHTLVRTIIAQKVQKKAERTFLGRIEAIVSSPVFRPEEFVKLNPEQFLGTGLNGRQVGAILDLAKRIQTGEVDFEKLAHESDETVIKTLTATKGIGKWTANIFLVFYRNNLDVLPENDKALKLAVKDLYPGKSLDEVSKNWCPYRSLAFWYLLQHRDEITGVRGSRAA